VWANAHLWKTKSDRDAIDTNRSRANRFPRRSGQTSVFSQRIGGTRGAQAESGSGSAVLTERNGSSETFFDVTIDTFRITARPGHTGRGSGSASAISDGSSTDSGRRCPGWITVHLGAGTSVLATDHHHRWDVRTDRTHGASALVIPIFGSGERLRLRIESWPSW
jgi:hypothetical protein